MSRGLDNLKGNLSALSNLVVALNNAMAIPIGMEAILIAMWLKAVL